MRATRWLWPMAVLCVLGVCVARGSEAIRWQSDLEVAKSMAAQSGRLVLVHFWAPWCGPCMRLDQEVFNQPTLGQRLAANYVPVKLNFDRNTAIARKYGVESLPADVVITPDGGVIDVGNSPSTATDYLAKMNRVAAHAERIGRKMPSERTAPLNPDVTRQVQLAGTAQAVSGAAPRKYSDDRYAEYFNRRETSSSGTPTAYGQAAEASGGPQITSQGHVTTNRPPLSPDVYAASTHVPPNVPGVPAQSVGPNPGGIGTGQPGGVPPAEATRSADLRLQPSSWRADYPQQQALPSAAVVGRTFAAPAMGTPPPGANAPFALDGRCPVSLVEQHEWRDGDRRFGAVHRGRTYLFAGPQQQQAFLAAPDRYSPVISGHDSVLVAELGLFVPGRREHGVFFENRVFLFASEASLAKFERNPERYAAATQQILR